MLGNTSESENPGFFDGGVWDVAGTDCKFAIEV
jgi:hypothetical protein